MDARGVVDDDREFWEHLCSMYALHESRIDEGFYWLQQNGYVEETTGTGELRITKQGRSSLPSYVFEGAAPPTSEAGKRTRLLTVFRLALNDWFRLSQMNEQENLLLAATHARTLPHPCAPAARTFINHNLHLIEGAMLDAGALGEIDGLPPLHNLFVDALSSTRIQRLLDMAEVAIGYYKRNVGFSSTRPSERKVTMPDKLAHVERAEAEQHALLGAVYELTEGNVAAACPIADAFELAKLDAVAGDAALAFLKSEYFVEPTSITKIRLTAEGVKHLRAAMKGPPAASQQFVGTTVVHVTGSQIGTLQTGHGSIATTTNTSGVSGTDFAAIFRELHTKVEQLPTAERAHVKEVIGDVEKETSVGKVLNPVRLKAYLDALASYAILAPQAKQLLDFFLP